VAPHAPTYSAFAGRSDPRIPEIVSNPFWFVYRKLVIKDKPPSGVDTIGCTRVVRDHLVRLHYLNSVFNFTHLPIQLLLNAGAAALLLAVSGTIPWARRQAVRRYPATGLYTLVLATLFFGTLTSLSFAIVGQYLWLGLQINRHPNYIVRSAEEHGTKDPLTPVP
jgi:hypothetical protein